MPLKLPRSEPLGEPGGGREAGDYSFHSPWRNENRLRRGNVLFICPPSPPSHSPLTLPECLCLSETDLSVENGPGTPSCVGIRSWGTWGGVRLLAYFHIH